MAHYSIHPTDVQARTAPNGRKLLYVTPDDDLLIEPGDVLVFDVTDCLAERRQRPLPFTPPADADPYVLLPHEREGLASMERERQIIAHLPPNPIPF